MRTVIVFAALLLAISAAANPIAIELYVDFDPPNAISYIDPAPYTMLNAYVSAELYAPAPVEAISFDLNVWEGTAIVSGTASPSSTPIAGIPGPLPWATYR
jgi:hypothetical protein